MGQRHSRCSQHLPLGQPVEAQSQYQCLVKLKTALYMVAVQSLFLGQFLSCHLQTCHLTINALLPMLCCIWFLEAHDVYFSKCCQWVYAPIFQFSKCCKISFPHACRAILQRLAKLMIFFNYQNLSKCWPNSQKPMFTPSFTLHQNMLPNL